MNNPEAWVTIYISTWTMELDMMDQAKNPNTEEAKEKGLSAQGRPVWDAQ